MSELEDKIIDVKDVVVHIARAFALGDQPPANRSHKGQGGQGNQKADWGEVKHIKGDTRHFAPV